MQALSGGIGFLYCCFRGGTCGGLCSAHMGRQVGGGSRLVQNSTMDLFVCGFEVNSCNSAAEGSILPSKHAPEHATEKKKSPPSSPPAKMLPLCSDGVRYFFFGGGDIRR